MSDTEYRSCQCDNPWTPWIHIPSGFGECYPPRETKGHDMSDKTCTTCEGYGIVPRASMAVMGDGSPVPKGNTCPTCGGSGVVEPAAPTVTDDMFDAACESAGVSQTGYAPWKEYLRAAIAAALAAAPTVNGLVMCGRFRLLAPDHCDTTGCRAWHVRCGHDRCEEKHNVAIVGPEVTT
jgi:hypothetical protein